jgi:hypothetical protein
MHDADEFRWFADACIAQANEPGLSRTQRETLLRMAAVWLELAEAAARVKDAMGDAIGAVAGVSKVPTSSRIH